jgi:hypothetical protein
VKGLKSPGLIIPGIAAIVLLIVANGLILSTLGDQWYEDRKEDPWGWPQPTAVAGALIRGYGPHPAGGYKISYHYGYRGCGGQVTTYRMEVTMYYGGPYEYTRIFNDGTTWGYSESHNGLLFEIYTRTKAFFKAPLLSFTLTAKAKLPKPLG